MKKILVVLMALVFVAAGVFGILTLGGKAGDPKETAQTTEAVDSSKPDGVSESGDSKNTEDADAGKNDDGGSISSDVSGGENSKGTSETDSAPYTGTSELVEKTLADMSLYEKICQMMYVTPEKITGIGVATAAGETTKQALEKYPVGGIVYFAQNLESKDQVKEMISNSQSYSKIGLFISTDEEGGIVNRLMDTVGTTYIDSMYNYKDEGTQKAYDNAHTIASDMAALGFNMDFAPVADVWSNPDNTVIGERAYSDDYAQAAELVGSAVKGFRDGGVICTLKHFPGHGDTAEDSHYSSAYVKRTKDEIMKDEMQPFTAGIDAGAEFVMVGHLIVPDIDEVPATLSYKIVTEMLRGDLGFDGLVITDSMMMSAINDNYTVADAVTKAVKAGDDMILEPADLDAAVTALEDAVKNGDITEDRIDESVRRILTLKEKQGLLSQSRE